MDIRLVSSDTALFRVCQEALTGIPGQSCVLSLASEGGMDTGARLYIWDYDPSEQLPEASLRAPYDHLFLVDSKDLSGFQSRTRAAERLFLVKPVTRDTLAAFLELALAAQIFDSPRENGTPQQPVQTGSSLLTRATHEFRGPLTLLKDNCDLLLSGPRDSFTGQQQEILRSMQLNVQRLSRLADAMSRLSSGNQSSHPFLRESGTRASASFPDPESAPLAEEKRVTIAVRVNQNFIGANPQMRELEKTLGEIAWSEAPVLILGETGSGKEVLARELHASSPRAQRPFLKLNCAALPSELVESELFGHERGSFTGAFQRKTGMFEMAEGGTILLDEIGDMEVRLQAKLLHVLQDREFQRIGGKEPVRVDVRVIAATHCDLETAIRTGTFREDLYYRLNVVALHVPPLRERRQDIVPLAKFLLKRHATKGIEPPSISPELEEALGAYHWPGNIRELENTMRKLMILRDPGAIIRSLNRRTQPAPTGPRPALEGPPADKSGRPLGALAKANQQAEVNAILTALQNTRWNRKQAAVLLGIDYMALLYKMKKLGIGIKPERLGDAPVPHRHRTVPFDGV